MRIAAAAVTSVEEDLAAVTSVWIATSRLVAAAVTSEEEDLAMLIPGCSEVPQESSS